MRAARCTGGQYAHRIRQTGNAGKRALRWRGMARAFADASTREIVTQAGTPKEKRFTGESYLLNYGLPHFFFHTTTAFAILRHNGVEVGKKDYIGTY